MKSLVVSLIVGASALAPALAVAQTNDAPITRAEVRADLVRVEQAGFQPARVDNTTYPADIQAAEAKIAAQDTQQSAAQGYGGTQQGSSAAGTASARAGVAGRHCVGPNSFCNLYSGG